MTPAPQKGPDLATIDPRAVDLAFRVVIGTMKPKARGRALALLQGMANDLTPDPVDLSVVRLRGFRGGIDRAAERRRIADGLAQLAELLA